MTTRYDETLHSKNLQLYLDRIASIMPLSADKEKELGTIIQAKNGEEREKAITNLVEANLKFVVAYVKKYQGMGMTLLDLINEGNLGLIEAAKRFDPARNVKFISYAVWWIRQAIIHSLTQNSRIYHIPQKLSDQISRMRRVRARLNNELGRIPTREEVAEKMGLNTTDLEDLEILAERNVSLSDPYYGEEGEYGDKIQDEMAPSVELQIIKNSVQEQVRQILTGLDEKEANVLKLRFGLVDVGVEMLLAEGGLSATDLPLTLQAIGDILHLTRERIRQIEKKAMRKLSRSNKLQQLKGYLN
ncbi:MAG: RNA polymerase sigma factor RpoD/SigA [Acidobacteria bacterium]|nr:RNA polymerase sigma factor RpoD/SigA [Acidobacteriota bacterium]MBU4329859.1 RNA polymerase sigma factor RpoD/SigA [Acidobacteriota bacterium]MBU4495631.1 RNA polymerase sigma factor RpoD/SigA [Acidobacteriota bacterium]MCG2814943.1 RNA polymerase sigma factor RpoD/SigA [Candidatus Aminicenantes bacterium]